MKILLMLSAVVLSFAPCTVLSSVGHWGCTMAESRSGLRATLRPFATQECVALGYLTWPPMAHCSEAGHMRQLGPEHPAEHKLMIIQTCSRTSSRDAPPVRRRSVAVQRGRPRTP